jgi:hypothetical protein
MFTLKCPNYYSAGKGKQRECFFQASLPPVVSVPLITNCQHNFFTVEHFDILLHERNTIQWNSKQLAQHESIKPSLSTSTLSQWAQLNSKINIVGLIAVSNLPITWGVISRGRLSL